MNVSTPAYSLKIGFDECRGVGLGDPEAARQAERTEAVEHAKVNRLGDPPHRRINRRLGNVEDAGGHHAVDVVVIGEGLAECGIAREMGEDSQLDLRIVGGEQRPTGRPCDERLANLPTVLGAHRDVLQVRVARAESSRGRHPLVERRVDPAVLGVNQGRQRIQVGALELGKLAMLDQELRERVFCCQLFEDLLGGCSARPLGVF